MAHWAEIDETNTVIRVVVGNNDDPDEGYQWLIDNLGGTWVKTSYNGNTRKNFAGKGFLFDPELDAFIPPKPDGFDSWVLNTDTCQWEAPIAYPGGQYGWDEKTTSWIQAPRPYASWTWDDSVNTWNPPKQYPTDGEIYSWDEDSLSWILIDNT